MSYTPPSGNGLQFDWQGAASYTPPAGDALEFGWGGLVAEPAWDPVAEAYRLEVSWSPIDGATEYRLRLLDDAQALLEEITTTGLAHTFTGLAAETTYHLELTGLDGSTELETHNLEVATPIGLPGGVSGIQHAFTTDSLTFTWEAAKDADKYLLTLSLDGAEVAMQTVTDLTATFTTLEDGTQYDLAIQAENAQGGGPIAYYQASTGYLAPQPPTNLRQFEERIIAVICRWDHPEPEKVLDTEVQLLYGDDLVQADALEGAATERTFIAPMASTDYLLRVRAGNPGGWSAWAEATVHTEVFPLIDSRLGVMGATYQEDVLHTDTWDGASEQLKGVVEAVQAEAGVTVGGYSLAQSYFPAPERVVAEVGAKSDALVPGASSLSIDSRPITLRLLLSSDALIERHSALSVESASTTIRYTAEGSLLASSLPSMSVVSAQAQYVQVVRSECIIPAEASLLISTEVV